MKQRLLVVIPTYGAFEYAALAIDSLMQHTTAYEPSVILIDDATPELANGVLYNPEQHTPEFARLQEVLGKYGHERCMTHYFPVNGGLTRSWNHGLSIGAQIGFDVTCVTNSDVYFPPHWDTELPKALNRFDLVGPVTNAPGTETAQYVGRYSINYKKHDGPNFPAINAVQVELLTAQKNRQREMALNGFCLLAKTGTWWTGQYDDTHVFRPRNDHNSKGERNPTPLMTLNEYELQGRWHAMGRKSAACLGSFVFHFRAVSRGSEYRRGDWTRLPNKLHDIEGMSG